MSWFSGLGTAASHTSVTSPTKRMPLPMIVRMSRCCSPLSPMAPRGVDSGCDGRFGDDPPTPHRSKQIVLAHHSIAILDQECQQVEYLRLKRQQSRTTAELTPVRVEKVTVE